MKNNLINFLLKQKSSLLLSAFSIFIFGSLRAQSNDFYQLKIYSFENELQVKQVDSFLKQAFLPALHRSGISKVGVFKPVNEEQVQTKKIYILIPLKSLEQFEKLPELLDKDQQFQMDGKDYINASYDNPPYLRIESIILKTFKGMPGVGIPNHPTPRSERIYELRSYQGATEKIFQRKVEMFNEGGEIEIFKELGFSPVFFGEVISGASMPNLMYMTTFSNETSQKEHWDAFQAHPVWNAIKEIEKYKNTVSKIDKYMLYPTEYSDL
jgi:hypothetical protein